MTAIIFNFPTIKEIRLFPFVNWLWINWDKLYFFRSLLNQVMVKMSVHGNHQIVYHLYQNFKKQTKLKKKFSLCRTLNLKVQALLQVQVEKSQELLTKVLPTLTPVNILSVFILEDKHLVYKNKLLRFSFCFPT